MLGGFAPLPLRLGGVSAEGVTAPQHARLAADLAAIARVMPFAVFRFSQTALNVPTVQVYYGRNGAGVNHAPSWVALGGDLEVEWTFGATYSDPNRRSSSIAIRHAMVTSNTTGVLALVTVYPDTNSITTKQGGAGNVTVAVWT